MKIGVVGTGHVGSTAAYSLAVQNICSELVLIDEHMSLAQAHAMDILHALPFVYPVRVYAGSYEDLADSAIVILAAGIAQTPGETRMQLLSRNTAVFADIVPRIMQHVVNPILLVATNPLDVMTQAATQFSGLPACRVIGTGTMLDTARLRTILGERYKISPHSIHAYVLGEHGDSEVVAWSSAEIAGIPLQQFSTLSDAPLTAEIKKGIADEVRNAAYQIIRGKGATYFGIGAALARLAHCILQDEHMVFTVCSIMQAVEGVNDIALSLPRVIGRDGILQTIYPNLDVEEKRSLYESALVIQQALVPLNMGK